MTRLSICIPTYQRGSSLQRLLASILPQCLGNDVEVVISDNGSSDDTEAVCTNAAALFPFLRYIRQSCNYGFAANLSTVVAHASGDYLWLLGDDDVVQPGAISHIASALARGNTALLLLNFSRYSENDESRARPEFCLEKDISVVSLDSLLKVAGVWASFMSICVVNSHHARRCLESSEIGRSTYAGFWLMLCVGSGRSCAILAEPLVLRRGGRWEQHRFLAWETYLVDFAQPVNWAAETGAISKATRRMLLGRMCRGFGSYVVVHTRLRGGSIEPRSLVLNENRGILECWLFVVPLAVMPRALLRAAVAVIGRVARLIGHEKVERAARALSP